MSDTISMLTAALTSDASSLETISHNIANANNVAYRREIGVSQSFANVADTLVAPVLQVPSAPQFGTAVDMTAGGYEQLVRAAAPGNRGPRLLPGQHTDGRNVDTQRRLSA